MGFQSISARRRRTVHATGPAQPVYPYYGVGNVLSQAQKTGSMITSLQGRGAALNRTGTFTLTSGIGQTMYYAYPVSYGQAMFVDLAYGMSGGWDGAHGNNGLTMGPIIVSVVVNGVSTPFYLYQTDWDNIGTVDWSVS